MFNFSVIAAEADKMYSFDLLQRQCSLLKLGVLLDTESVVSLVVLALSDKVRAVISTVLSEKTLCFIPTDVAMEPPNTSDVCV